MDQSSVFWIAAAVVVFVFIDVLVVEVRRCLREGRRIVKRLLGYADLPIISLAAGMPGEIARFARALEEVAALLVRARIALAALGIVRSNNSTR